VPRLILDSKTYLCAENESVLEALNRGGAAIPSSCQSGVCQTCLLKVVKGSIPNSAQIGLKDTLRAQNYILACQCRPQEPLHIERPGAEASRIRATIGALNPLNRNTLAVTLKCPEARSYQAGQFINVFQDQVTSRSYSLASISGEDRDLILHVGRVPQGRVSGWIHETLSVGDVIEITPPIGNCFYVAADLDQPLLLLGTGTGLAPLYAIAREALNKGHRGPIYLYHGSRQKEGLYLQKELRNLSARFPHFHYQGCISQDETSNNEKRGRALDIALSDLMQVRGFRIFLCGNPNMVASAKKRVFLAGAALKDIYADAFVRAAH
jgi:NAD(P)H-flavin reductase/ferredoxin